MVPCKSALSVRAESRVEVYALACMDVFCRGQETPVERPVLSRVLWQFREGKLERVDGCEGDWRETSWLSEQLLTNRYAGLRLRRELWLRVCYALSLRE